LEQLLEEEYDNSDRADIDLCYRTKLAGYSIFTTSEMSQWVTRLNQ
jgi:hypothetical protein